MVNLRLDVGTGVDVARLHVLCTHGVYRVYAVSCLTLAREAQQQQRRRHEMRLVMSGWVGVTDICHTYNTHIIIYSVRYWLSLLVGDDKHGLLESTMVGGGSMPHAIPASQPASQPAREVGDHLYVIIDETGD